MKLRPRRIIDPCWRRTVFMLMCLALICIPTSLFSVMPNVTGASVALTLFLTACGATIVIVTTLTTVVIPNEVLGFVAGLRRTRLAREHQTPMAATRFLACSVNGWSGPSPFERHRMARCTVAFRTAWLDAVAWPV